MKTLLIDIGNPNNLAAFLKAVEKLDFIESVKIIDHNDSADSALREPSENYNWIKPDRPATDKEIDRLIEKMETPSKGLTTDEVKIEMKKWMEKHRR